MKRQSGFWAGLLLSGIVVAYASIGYGSSINKLPDPMIEQVESLVTNADDINAGIVDAFAIVHQASPSKNDVLIPWLKQKGGTLPAPFTMELGYRLFPKKHTEGLRWYVLGRVRAAYDNDRCADPTASGAITILIQEYRPLLQYASTHMKEYLSAWQDALVWETKHPYSATPVWLCSHGLEPNMAPEKDWPAIRIKSLAESQALIKKHLSELNKK